MTVAIFVVMLGGTTTDVFAQSATAPFVIRLIRGNGDTVVYTRNPTALRFGASLSASMPYHFGNLVSPVSSVFTCDQFYNLQPGALGSGGGSVGLMMEYVPLSSDWGLSLNASFPDYRAMESETPFPPAPGSSIDILNRSIFTRVSTTYITIQPQVRFSPVGNSGFHVLFGGNWEIATASSMSRSVTRQELDRSEVVRNIPFVIDQFRYGISVGAGWDVIGGIVGGFRMIVTPGFSVQAGTPMYSTYESSWNSVVARGTFCIKFSPDVIGEEVVPAVPIPLEPPPVISALRKAESKLNTAVDARMVAIGMLMPREPRTESVPEKKQDIAAAPPTPVTSAPESAPIAPKPEAPEKVAAPKPEPVPPAAPIRIPYKGKMRVNTPEVFASYQSELDTAVTPELLGYLDEVVKLMKSNSTLMLRIEGHADNFGASAAETQRISDERALQVVRFMMSQGIARSRLLASGFGARNPVASNRTPQGRAANRRVEISILRP